MHTTFIASSELEVGTLFRMIYEKKSKLLLHSQATNIFAVSNTKITLLLFIIMVANYSLLHADLECNHLNNVKVHDICYFICEYPYVFNEIKIV